jgi:hypothetical protein
MMFSFSGFHRVCGELVRGSGVAHSHDFAPASKGLRSNAAYVSATVFRLARPVSKSLPTMLSISKNKHMTFDM